MAFETYPIVIDLFPVLVILPAALSFFIAYAMSQGKLSLGGGVSGRLIKRTRLILALIVGITVALMFIVPLMGFLLDNAYLISTMYLFGSLLHIEIIVLGGVALCLLLASSYYARGVSGFCIATLTLVVIPAWIILSTENVEGILGFILDGFDFFVFFLLIFPGSSDWLMKRMLGVDKDTEKKAIESLSRDVASGYISEAMRFLRIRRDIDQDEIAREAIDALKETEGVLATLIEEAASDFKSSETLEEKEPAQPFGETPFHPHQASLRRTAIEKQLRPSGTWTLTNSQFKKRVKTNRSVYLILLLAMIGLTIVALADMSLHVNQWIVILCVGTVSISLVLAFIDNTFVGRRCNSKSVAYQVLRPLSGIDEILAGAPPSAARSTERTESVIGEMPYLERRREEIEPVFLTEEHLIAASGHTKKFLERVKAGKNEVYEESIHPLYLGAAGAIISIPPGMVALLTSPEPLPIFNDILMVLFLLGLPILVTGALWWYKWTRERSFHGIRRSILESAISYLDINEAGIEDLGFAVYPTPPAHAALLKLRGPMAARTALEKLGNSSSVQQDTALLKETVEIEGRMLRFFWCLIPAVLVVAVVVFYISISLSPILTIIMLSLVLFSLVGSLIGYISYHRRKRTLVAMEAKTESVEPIERLSQILGMVEREYAFPLRVHVMRTHKELLYTGTTFKTTTGVVLREAVYLPR
ncbi:MAG: hypothetical protein ACFFAY_00955 [Promethearchaeota archaeon]